MLIHYSTASGPIAPGPPSRAPLILGVSYSMLFVAAVVVTLRITVKARLRKLAIEDALIVASTLITLGLLIITTFAIRYGFGLHVVDMETEWWPGYSKFSYATNAIACIPYPLTKLSMLFFYLRLAPHSTFRKVCIGTMSYIVLSSAVITMLLLFPCTPVRGGWDHDPALGAKCIDAGNFFYFYCSMNVVTDIMLMMIPIPILLRMQLPRRARYGLVGMFSAGILITAITTYGIRAMYVAYHSPDVTWDGSYSWMWALAEFNAGIITASMPSMLLYIKWIRGETDKSREPPRQSSNPTIGGGTPGKFGRNKPPMDVSTCTSHLSGSEVYIMREMDDMVKSTEPVAVEIGVALGGDKLDV